MQGIDNAEFKARRRYLKRYKKIKFKISILNERLYVLNEKINKIKSPNFSGMPKGGGTHISMAELISDKIELEQRIKSQREKARIIRGQIIRTIDDLEDPLQAEVLESFFIDGDTIEEIASDLGYTPRYIAKIYSQGINNVNINDVHI